jgi:putative addiction module CopG family antidote
MNMNESLPEEHVNFVKDKVSTGRYGSSSEVVREGLRLMEKTERREAEKLKRLGRTWQEGVDNGDAGEIDFTALKKEARADKAAALATVKRALDSETERAAKAFLGRLQGKYPVVEGILYGSRARGDFAPDSDADIAVILKGERGDRVAVSLDMAGVAFDVMMETGVRVQGLPLWAEEVERPERFPNPALIETIMHEGVHL